jgi:hypothetical protein
MGSIASFVHDDTHEVVGIDEIELRLGGFQVQVFGVDDSLSCGASRVWNFLGTCVSLSEVFLDV